MLKEVVAPTRSRADNFCSNPVSKAPVKFPDSLAGRANINFNMYSGYVNITDAPDYLFYWYAAFTHTHTYIYPRIYF
ncbi:hypothetical protein EON63_18685 [archaeon]|nr:MAG: hypothetical protein EON63_18685 [archaeon]